MVRHFQIVNFDHLYIKNRTGQLICYLKNNQKKNQQKEAKFFLHPLFMGFCSMQALSTILDGIGGKNHNGQRI